MILTELRDALGQRYGDRLRGLYLYGSHARGDWRSDSDVDVLVVLMGEVEPLAEIGAYSDIVAEMTLRHGMVISTFPLSESWFVSRHSPFLDQARKDAVLVE